MFGRGERQKNEAGAGNEKQNLYEQLKRFTEILSIGKVLKAALFFLILSVISDTFHFIELCYDEGNLIAVIVLLWTFTISFSVYCIEHSGESYYGISRADILLSDLGWKGLSVLAILVFMELGALIVAIVFKLSLTIIVIALEQICITIYIPMLVILKTSYTNTLEQIAKEVENAVRFDLKGLYRKIKGGRNSSIQHNSWPRLFQMIRQLDYTNDSSMERLLGILKKVSGFLQEELRRTKFGPKDGGPETQKAVNAVSCQIVLDVLKAVQDREILVDFLSRLMACSTSLEFGQGVMMALLENPTLENISVCQELLWTEMEYQRELQIWCAVYNAYMQTSVGEEWRSLVYTEQIFRELYADWGKSDMKTAIELWEQMQDSQINYQPLFRYIFPIDGKELL